MIKKINKRCWKILFEYLEAADEILIYHPLNCDVQTRKTQWEEFFVVKFLSRLDSSLNSAREHLLDGDSAPTACLMLCQALLLTILDLLLPLFLNILLWLRTIVVN